MNSVNKFLIATMCFGVVVLTANCGKVDVPTPNTWSTSIQIQQNTITEERIVSDTEARTGLFTHNEYSTAQPLTVRKVEPNRWIAVFEKAGKEAPLDVQIERISDTEYRVVIVSPSER